MVNEDIHELIYEAQDLNIDELVQLIAEFDPNVPKSYSDEVSDGSVKCFTIKYLKPGLDLANSLKTYLALYYEIQNELQKTPINLP